MLSRSAIREATPIQGFLYLKSNPALLVVNQPILKCQIGFSTIFPRL